MKRESVTLFWLHVLRTHHGPISLPNPLSPKAFIHIRVSLSPAISRMKFLTHCFLLVTVVTPVTGA